MLQAIIFDFGGVFMKTTDYQPRHQWDHRLGLPPGSVERIVHGSESWRAAQKGQLSMESYWQDVAQQLHLTADEVRQLADDFYSGDSLDSALVQIAKSLRERGLRVALLSNDGPHLRHKLDHLGITDLFDPLVISADIGVMKPDARAYQAVLDLLGCRPDETLFIDDMPANIEGAQAVGMNGIQYTTPASLQTALNKWLPAPPRQQT
jgi:epoxide hydrolase-like predicted phosphatase